MFEVLLQFRARHVGVWINTPLLAACLSAS
jgi:hypothetical protein